MDHTIMHFEIPANDVEKLKAFYEKVFGWTIVQAARAYRVLDNPNRAS